MTPSSQFPASLDTIRQDRAACYTVLDGVPGKKVCAIACTPDGVFIATEARFARYDEKANQWQPLIKNDLPSSALDCLLSGDVGPARKRAERFVHYTGTDWQKIAASGLCPLRIISHAVVSDDRTLWVASNSGTARLRNGVWRYFSGHRWLPSDTVNGLDTDAQGRVWLATSGGVACIETIPMTWTDKAAHYEEITVLRHDRDGFIADCRLTIPGDLTSALPIATDNDGLWTSLYVCAEAFRWAVTGEAEARERARRSMNALLQLVDATGIPGFPARALIREGERVEQSDPGPNWYPSPTMPDVLYKNDTSSDEIDGHYLAWCVYSELVADAKEKARIAAACHAVTTHILDHNYTLVGPTGKRTSWGVWSPEILNHDPNWAAERGLNSLEILSHLRVAQHLCPDPRFASVYRDLIETHGYAANTLRQKMVPLEAECNHSDDELAACAYYPLLMLENDPDLRAMYLQSLERTQAILRPERSPFHNVIYSACTGRACDTESVLEWLADAPLDLRHWTMTNSNRPDVALATNSGRFGEQQLSQVLPPGECVIGKWNRNPYAPDGGNNGASEEDGTFWLLPYWMGQYHGGVRG